MLSLAQVCRCAQYLRAPSRILLATTKSHCTSSSRQLITQTRWNNTSKGLRISNIIRNNGIVARFCANSPKQETSKVVGYWLLGCSGMVFTAVVLGGVTRLTESGLSMVTWKLLGEKMPRTEEEWLKEFENYQQFPEYKYKNMNMTLSEFKWIWWMEFAHRTWGRAIGAAVFLPAAFFWIGGYLNKALKVRVAACCTLVGLQGLMGWYMVKSGLEDRFQGPADVPRVSQYRLAAHLGLAFVLYMALLGGALRVLRPGPAGALGAARPGLAPRPGLARIATAAHLVKGMAFVTALSGAFVAGLDAGLVYNSFPKMGDSWVPPDALALRPALRNLTENPATVQLDHRVLGSATLLAAGALALLARRAPLAPAARRAALAVGAAAALQAALGVLTLLHYVPTPLAAAHQSGSLLLLSLAVWLTHEIKLLRYIPK